MKKSYGHIAYETYCIAVGGKSFTGDLLPNFDQLTQDHPEISKAWIKTANAIVRETIRDTIDGLSDQLDKIP